MLITNIITCLMVLLNDYVGVPEMGIHQGENKVANKILRFLLIGILDRFT